MSKPIESPADYSDSGTPIYGHPPLPGWAPACPICSVHEGPCLAMATRGKPEFGRPKRPIKRPHSGRVGYTAEMQARAYIDRGGQP